jgi:hypothetical protein
MAHNADFALTNIIREFLFAVATPPPASTGAEADLPEVKLDEYWPAVKELSADGKVLVMDFYTQ